MKTYALRLQSYALQAATPCARRYTTGLAKGLEKEGVKFRCGIDEGRVQTLAAVNGGVDVTLGDPSATFEGETFYGGAGKREGETRRCTSAARAARAARAASACLCTHR